MSDSMKIGQNYFPNQHLTVKKPINNNQINNLDNFNKIFEEKLNNPIKFSHHAKQRIDFRGIEIDSNIIDKLSQAVDKAEQKGSKDSLILMNEIAFVVNIPNRTVVTTVDNKTIKEHIFTNIDSAIIL